MTFISNASLTETVRTVSARSLPLLYRYIIDLFGRHVSAMIWALFVLILSYPLRCSLSARSSTAT